MTLTICSRCVLDSTLPDISFDESGTCNYCRVHDKLSNDYPRGQKGAEEFDRLVLRMKIAGKSKPYDCVVGVSGGTDSTYLLWLCKQYGLRPLAVTVDNGWQSEIAVANIHQALERLHFDLQTYVINWEEMRKIHLAFIRAGLPWPDGTSDIAIRAGLYRVAKQHHIKFILNGHDFRTEGRQPNEWTWTDGRMIKSICKREGIKLRSFPNQTLWNLVYDGYISGIKDVRPFWYLNYSKIKAREIISRELNWEYYGGHHHENVFTRYIIGVWMPQKFGIDKRKITLAAHVREAEHSRQEALELLRLPPYDPTLMKQDEEYVTKKLGISKEEFAQIWRAPNSKFTDYPSYYPVFQSFKGVAAFVLTRILNYRPMMVYDVKQV
jgi:N-acetyl sugar amidotransferase